MKLLLLVFFTFFVVAESLDFRDILNSNKTIKFLKISYTIKQGDDFAEILKRFVKNDSVISRNTEMISKTIDSNPTVSDWRNLPVGKEIQLYLDIDYVDFDKAKTLKKALYSSLVRKNQESMEEDKKFPRPEGFKGSVFYMGSYGKFTQENSSVGSISFSQNSPLTLGLSTSFYPKEKPYTFSSSIYFSYLLAAASNISSQDVDVPLEVGANAYGEYRIKKWNLNIYGGLDFEKFTTFNLEGVKADSLIYFDVNKVLYLTVGGAKNAKIMNLNIFSKLSFSKSVLSSRDVGYSGATNNASFTGSKILLYLFHRVNEKYFVHTLFKYHWMSGPSDISTLRVGVGFGRLIF